MNRVVSYLKKNRDIIGVALFMLVVYVYIMYWCRSDLQIHAKYATFMLTDHRLFDNNFLMYLMTNVLAGFSGALLPTQLALICLIAIANTVKYVLVKNEFAKSYSLGVAKAASLALIFVFIIPFICFSKAFGFFPSLDPQWYIGYYVPNVWHNSTILCMMPLAIITFFLSVRQFDCFDNKRNWFIVLFVVLGTLMKPSFFFIYAVAYPLCIFVRYRFKKEFFYSLIPILAGCACMLYEYLTIYDGEDECEVVIDVFQLFTAGFWKVHFLGFAISVAFPIIFVLFYWREIHRDLVFWFVLIMLVVAFGISWCCAETGYRAYDGNFYWQIIPAMWFTYYYMLNTILKDCVEKREEGMSIASLLKETWSKFAIRNKIVISLYLLHVGMGVAYFLRYMITNDYF